METSKEDLPKGSEDLAWKYLKFVKEHLALFVIVPTLLGGVWQVFSLANIGVAYIRFFSITQLVSDGIILLGALSLMTLLVFSTFRGGKLFSKAIKDWKINFINIPILLALHIASIYLLGSVIVKGFLFLISTFKMNIDGDTLMAIFVFLAPLNFILQESSRKLDDILKDFYEQKLRPLQNRVCQILINLGKWVYEKYVFFVHIVVVFSIFFWVIFVFKLLSLVGGYSIPNNLINLSKVDELLMVDYNLKPEAFDISYMNDSYIFIEYTVLSQKEIDELVKKEKPVPYEVIILKTDVLFDSPTP